MNIYTAVAYTVTVTSGSCATRPGNAELGKAQKAKSFWTSASAHALHLPSIVVQLFEAQKKNGKIQDKLFLEGGMVWKVSRGLKKCKDALEWCRKAQKVQKGVKFGNQEGAGKL